MRALVFVLLLARPAQAADPYAEAFQILQGDRSEQALLALRPRLREKDRPVLDQVIAARDAGAFVDASSELLRRWAASAPKDLKVQESVITTLARTARLMEKDSPRPELLDEAIKRARVLARSHPRELRVQSLFGALLGASNQSPLEALTALGRCLEIDRKEAQCRAMFDELSRYYLSARCKPEQMRSLELVSGPTVFGKDSYVEAADFPAHDGANVVVVRMTEPARLRLARLTAELAKSGGELEVKLDGQVRVRLQIHEALGRELVELPRMKVAEVCRDLTIPVLPPSLRKWTD